MNGNDNFDVTILSIEEIRKYKDSNLDIILHSKSKLTDYALEMSKGDKITEDIFSHLFPFHDKTMYKCDYNVGDGIICGDSTAYSLQYASVDDPNIGLRPVLNFKNSNSFEEASKKIMMIDDTPCVVFGKYPQNRVDKKLDKILDDLYYSNKLQHIELSFKTDYSITNIGDVYVFEGEEYVKGISDNWYKLADIIWYMDRDNKRLISKESLISGISYGKEGSNIRFEDSNIYKFLNSDFKESLFKTSDFNLGKTKEISNIINKINKYLGCFINKDSIKDEIKVLIEKYNEDIRIINTENTVLRETEETLYAKLCSDLNNILHKLEINYENSKANYEILDLINACIDTLNGYESSNKNDLIADIKELRNEILPNLDEIGVSKNNELMDVLISKRKDVLNVLDNIFSLNDFQIKYKNIEEFEMDFRKQFHKYLSELNDNVKKSTIVSDTFKEYKDVANEVVEESRNNVLENYYKELSMLVKDINERGNEEDLEKLRILSHNDITNHGNINETIEIILKTIRELNIIKMDIDEREQAILNINNYVINMDDIDIDGIKSR